MDKQFSANFIALGSYQKDLIREHELAEVLRIGQSHLLEMIAHDAPLEIILDSLLQLFESQSNGVLCSVVLVDDSGQNLQHCAAPSLAKSFCDLVNCFPIGEILGRAELLPFAALK